MPKRTSGASGSNREKSPEQSETNPNQLYRQLVDTVMDYAIFALDSHGNILTWNAGAERIKGYRRDEIVGKHFSIFYPKEKIDEGFPQMELRRAAVDGRFEDEGWRLRKDGSRFWANVIITALRSPSGELVGYGKITRDLSDKRKAQEELRASEERFRLLVQGVRDYAIFMLDPSGFVTTWNEGAERIKGYTADEIVGRHFSTFYTADDLAANKPKRKLEIAASVGKFEEEGWRVRKNGSRFWASVLITALRNDDGDLIGFAKITRDLTERHQSELRALDDARRVAAEEAARESAEVRAHEMRALAEEMKRQALALELRSREAEQARHRADEANRAKSEFLAAMSHELRTPLNAIAGYTQLMMLGVGGQPTLEHQQHLERIMSSQEHLLGVINDILNFSRIEAGQVSYEISDVDVRDALASVAHMIAPQARRKDMRFDYKAGPGELIARADPTKLEQILLNLLSNAVKFTAAGGSITLTAERRGDRIAFVVRDSGIGIPADHLEKIFEPFIQIGRSLASPREGTGLGLAISRDLARALDGDITVSSEPGKGSTFTLTLPAAEPESSR